MFRWPSKRNFFVAFVVVMGIFFLPLPILGLILISAGFLWPFKEPGSAWMSILIGFVLLAISFLFVV